MIETIKVKPNLREVQASIIACFPVFLSGFDVTFSANISNLIPNQTITVTNQALIGSMNLFAGAFGGIVNGYLVNRIGRRNSIFVAQIMNVIAWFTITYFSFSIEIVLLSRMISGFACGMINATTIYISEISNKNSRGRLLSFCALSMSLGMNVSYVVQYYFSSRMVSLISLIFSFFGCIQIYILPETKYWLIRKNDTEGARESMLWFDENTSVHDLNREIEEMQSQHQDAIQEKSFSGIFKRLANFKGLIFCLLLSLLRCGSNRVSIAAHPYYYYSLFKLPVSTGCVTLIQGSLETVFSMFSASLVDIFPRKYIMQASCWVMNTCMVIAFFRDPLVLNLGLVGEWILLLSLMVYVATTCAFLTGLIIIVTSEIASTLTEYRGVVLSVTQFCNNTLLGVYSGLFPIVLSKYPLDYFLFYSFVSTSALSLVVCFVPETIGKALHKCGWQDKVQSAQSESTDNRDSEKLLLP